MFILYLIVVFVLIAIAIALMTGLRSGAPYVPSSKASIKRMLDMAEVRAGELVLDLGSGDGRVLVYAAEKYNARGLGIEITLLYYLWSKVKVTLKGLSDRITLKREDMYASDISDADVVVMFLLQDTNQKLKEKLKTELRPGTRIVSHYFTFDNWKPVAVDDEHHIYLYIVPET